MAQAELKTTSTRERQVGNEHPAAEDIPAAALPASPWVPWGKLRRDGSGRVAAIHTLTDHMLDVASCFLALARCPAIRRSLQVAAGASHRALTEVDLQRLAVLAFMHDIGKANAGFQAKYWQTGEPLARAWPLPCGHGAEGWALISGEVILPARERFANGLQLHLLDCWGESVKALLRASISHHGRPVGDRMTGGKSCWDPVRRSGGLIYDPAQTIEHIGATALVAFPGAFVDDHPALPNGHAFVHLFGGLVQLADWLGSDTREGFFPYTEPGEERSRTASARALNAVRVLGLDPAPLRATLGPALPAFAQAFDLASPRPMQLAMADDDLGPVVVLEAETGSGKTEAALWRFLHLFIAGKVDSLYFALPTRVAATQLCERVAQFVARVWPSDAPVVVRALPGDEAADGATKVMHADYQVFWSDDPGDELAARRWSAEGPKRFLAATIAVGTIDQALLGALMVKHAHLRQALLARSLLVVDEVHASDAYMTTLLEQLLKAHLACGGHALLLSATLGAAARTRYLNLGAAQARRLVTPPLEVALALPYPAIGTRRGDSAATIAIDGNPLQKTVHWQTLDIIDSPARIATLAVDAAALGARVLVVRNTVPAAVATLREVEQLNTLRGGDWLFTVAGVSTLHHSRFSRQDRRLLDAEVQVQLGKHRAAIHGRIIVGTQTLEQSLDIDADLLITDLCPMDVLLQRLGRLHRHQRPSGAYPNDRRPDGFIQTRAWVLTPAGDDLTPLLKRSRHGLGPMIMKNQGMQGVYIDVRALEATSRLIKTRPEREIPKENRELVERATHPQAMDAIAAEMGGDWPKFGQDYEGNVGARASLGHLQALAYGEPYLNLNFPDDGQAIATRLGGADRLVTFDDAPRGPFGQLVKQLSLRHHQLPHDADPDDAPRDVVPLGHETGFEFALGSTRYRYSRMGVERLRESSAANAFAT